MYASCTVYMIPMFLTIRVKITVILVIVFTGRLLLHYHVSINVKEVAHKNNNNRYVKVYL